MPQQRATLRLSLVAYSVSLVSVMENKSVVDSLILEVRNRPCLWDKKHELHKNRGYLDREWEQIAETLNKNKDQIKTKWRNLRDQFSRELKKNPIAEDGSPIVEKYFGKWAYYESLTFLKDNVYLNPSDETRYDDSQIDDFTKSEPEVKVIIKQDPDIDELEGDAFLDSLDAQDTSDSTLITPMESNEIPRKRLWQRKSKSSYIQRQMSMQNERMQTSRLSSREVDDDLHFALSLVPYLRRLEPLRKLVVRNEMQNLLLGELLAESSSGPGTPKK